MATVRPREDYLNDRDYFMAVALLTAQRSRDPRTQVGACIVKDGKVVSVGYNYMPSGDEKNPWEKNAVFGPSKLQYISFAVNNAIIQANPVDLKGTTIYVTVFPSNKCANEIILAGIKRVVYLSDKYAQEDFCKVAKKILTDKEVSLELFYSEGQHPREDICINFKPITGRAGGIGVSEALLPQNLR